MTTEPQHTHLTLRRLNVVQVDRPLVGQKGEDVERPNGLRPPLLVAEDQIDPLVKLAGHKLALQCLSEEEQLETLHALV